MVGIIRESEKTKRAVVLRKILKEFGYNTIAAFQKASNLSVDGLFGINSYNTLYKLVLEPQNVSFTGFIDQVTNKNCIVLHHSASGDDAKNMYNIWQVDSQGAVATHVGIERDGTLVKGFDESKWAYHTGRGFVDSRCCSVELMNWGYLNQLGNSYYNWVNREVPISEVIKTNYRGFSFFQNYTERQINKLKYWILLNALRFDIPLKYNEFDLWNVNNNALNGVKGIYTHCSFWSDRSDIAPHKNIVEILKNLESYENE